MNTKLIDITSMIELIKENQWVFWIIIAIGTIIASYLLIKNRINKIAEINRNIYENTLRFRFKDLFEYSQSDEISPVQLVTKDYNPIKIARFCYQIEEFKKKGNSFKGLYTNILFNKLHRIALKINSTKDNKFLMNTITKDDNITIDFFKKNEKNFAILKKRFKSFYLKTFDNL